MAQGNRYVDGYTYGVMFHDGSVLHCWTGKTQAVRARAAYIRIKADLIHDNIRFVRHHHYSPNGWEVVPEEVAHAIALTEEWH